MCICQTVSAVFLSTTSLICPFLLQWCPLYGCCWWLCSASCWPTSGSKDIIRHRRPSLYSYSLHPSLPHFLYCSPLTSLHFLYQFDSTWLCVILIYERMPCWNCLWIEMVLVWKQVKHNVSRSRGREKGALPKYSQPVWLRHVEKWCRCHFVYWGWAAISVCMLPPVTLL